jgi:hypothetical protein
MIGLPRKRRMYICSGTRYGRACSNSSQNFNRSFDLETLRYCRWLQLIRRALQRIVSPFLPFHDLCWIIKCGE